MAEVAVSNADGVLAEVRGLAQAVVAPGAVAVDRESRFPGAQLSALGRVGALGLLVPREHDGVGAGLVALADACEALGGACASRAGAVMAPTNGVLRTWSGKAIAGLQIP
jgi:alkylation response protein AidB-like acyl-CoA dehydrogenase